VKVGDLVSIYYTSDSGVRVDLAEGIILRFGTARTGEDLVFVLRSDGLVEEYSRNFRSIKFEVINESLT